MKRVPIAIGIAAAAMLWALWAAPSPLAAAIKLIATTGAPSSLVVKVEGSVLAVRDAAGDATLHLPEGTNITAAANLRDGWIVAGTTTSPVGSKLYLAISKAGRVSTLPQPGLAGNHLVATPVLFVRDHVLEGVAWLEGAGSRSLAVQAASWTGAGWAPTQLVSPRAPGSQLALAAAVLSDGSQLLVWSRFDGHFDQIAWSLRRGEYWSAPRTLTADEVPDITPGVTAVGSGALVAWSHFDGHDYRIALARFDGQNWSQLGMLAQRGAISPTFTPSANGKDVALLFPSVAPKEWAVQLLNSRGEPLRQGSIPLVSYSRPLLVETGASWALQWPDRSSRVALGPLGATSSLSPEQP